MGHEHGSPHHRSECAGDSAAEGRERQARQSERAAVADRPLPLRSRHDAQHAPSAVVLLARCHHARPWAIHGGCSPRSPCVRKEAAHLRTDLDAIEVRSDGERKRAELEEDRRRAGVRYEARAMTDQEFLSKVAAIDDELAGMPVDGFVDLPEIVDGWWDIAVGPTPTGMAVQRRQVIEALNAALRPSCSWSTWARHGSRRCHMACPGMARSLRTTTGTFAHRAEFKFRAQTRADTAFHARAPPPNTAFQRICSRAWPAH